MLYLSNLHTNKFTSVCKVFLKISSYRFFFSNSNWEAIGIEVQLRIVVENQRLENVDRSEYLKIC